MCIEYSYTIMQFAMFALTCAGRQVNTSCVYNTDPCVYIIYYILLCGASKVTYHDSTTSISYMYI